MTKTTYWLIGIIMALFLWNFSTAIANQKETDAMQNQEIHDLTKAVLDLTQQTAVLVQVQKDQALLISKK